MSESAGAAAAAVESVANVLDRELKPLIADWLGRVEEVLIAELENEVNVGQMNERQLLI
jgi:hypothetical protein